MMTPQIFLAAMFAIYVAATPVNAQQVSDSSVVQALKSLQELDQRLHKVGFQLATENVTFCPETKMHSGMLLHDINQYGDKIAARAVHGFEAPISVNAVTGLNARSIKPGDGIIAINENILIDAKLDNIELDKEEVRYRRMAAVNRLVEDQLDMRSNFRNSDSFVRLLRGGTELTINISPKPACKSRFEIRPDKSRQASADGRTVTITSALAEYVQSDDELAAIAAHELAHNILKHKEQLNRLKVNRGFFGQFGKSSKRIKETEIEADRLSIWLMVNAGYDPRAAIDFWTRYGKQYGKGIFSASTHYRWKKRVKLFEEEIAKVETMQPDNGRYAPPLLAKITQ